MVMRNMLHVKQCFFSSGVAHGEALLLAALRSGRALAGTGFGVVADRLCRSAHWHCLCRWAWRARVEETG